MTRLHNPSDRAIPAKNPRLNSVPTRIHGRLRPHLERVLSLNAPARGWINIARTSPAPSTTAIRQERKTTHKKRPVSTVKTVEPAGF